MNNTDNWGPHKDGDLFKEVKKVDHSKWITKQPINLKYPQSVGENFKNTYPGVNYNTHDSSQYAKRRSTTTTVNGQKIPPDIDEDTPEPFVFFEFMEVATKRNMGVENYAAQVAQQKKRDEAFQNSVSRGFGGSVVDSLLAKSSTTDGTTVTETDDYDMDEATRYYLMHAKDKKSMWNKVLRVYGGSIAMYMPTDIQINDQIVYNENSRKLFGTLQGLMGADAQDIATHGLGTGVVATGAAIPKGMDMLAKAFGKSLWSGIGSKVGGAIGVAGVSVAQDEYQRSTGQAKNPHEYMAYQSTGMRSFSFNFTFLPDNKKESDEATAIIKQFRMAAHAYRNNSLTITVPDHLIVSFHGAKDMIQLPPVVIEAVNVTYNPNNTSFFRYGNAPVEIGLAITLKEITPIYRQDVEGGW